MRESNILRIFSVSSIVGVFLLALLPAGCSPGREYELRGQILAVKAARQEITVKHEDIRGFMPAMTMPFKVRERSLLEGRSPGELIRATLVVRANDAYLKGIERTGQAPLSEAPPGHSAYELVEAGDTVPDTEFVDQTGATRRLSDWRDQRVAVTFIYTRCPLPNFCPLMDRHFAAAQREIARDHELRDRVHLVSVSFDPEFDTPAVLAEYARKAGADPARWSFVTGQRDEIDRFASRFGVSIIRGKQTADAWAAPRGAEAGRQGHRPSREARERAGVGPRAPEEIVHNLRTAVIGTDGRLHNVLSGNEWQPSELLAELRSAGARR